MRQLSKREKILLYLLAVFAVTAGMIMLVIVPAKERADALDEQILTSQMQVDSMQALIRSSTQMEEEIAQFEADITLEQAYYLPAMTSDDLDKFITGLLQEHGLVAQSLAISSDGSQDESAMIRTYRVDVLANGRVSQFLKLVDTVKATDGLRLAELSFKKTVTPAPTATPKPLPTPKPKRRVRATPTPTPSPVPTPTPYDPSYTMEMAFVVMEYDENAELPVAVPSPSATPQADQTDAEALLAGGLD